MFVPVVNQNNKPLMPTSPSRARRWIESGKATGFYKKGVFCVRLNVETQENKQEIVVGIDPGSKREAYTIKSEAHTYLNVLSNAVDWVKDAVTVRRQMRRARRFRNTRYRKARFNNRRKSKLPPSTRARWHIKLRICSWLKQMFPITTFVVEDIQAKTTGKKKWDCSFSPLEVGKNWFYTELSELGEVETKQGYETKELRDNLGLQKSKAKLSDKFEAHNVDSWVLANEYTGGHVEPDNKGIFRVIPLRFHRRQLHAFQPAKGSIRRNYGGTRSLGFKRGSLVKHNKLGVCYVGGSSKGRISLHSLESGKRLGQNIVPGDCKFRCYLDWRYSNSSPC
jgi:hypothetical protein